MTLGFFTRMFYNLNTITEVWMFQDNVLEILALHSFHIAEVLVFFMFVKTLVYKQVHKFIRLYVNTKQTL